MNPWLQTGAIILTNVLLAAFVYGQLTQKVKDLTSWSKEHNLAIRDHGQQLMNHESRISHIEGRKGVPCGSD